MGNRLEVSESNDASIDADLRLTMKSNSSAGAKTSKRSKSETKKVSD